MKIGLKQKILLGLIPLLVVSFTNVAVISFQKCRNIIIKQLENNLTTKTDYMREKVSGFFSQREVLLESEAENITRTIEKNKDINLLDNSDTRSHFTSELNLLKEKYGIIDIYVTVQPC